MLPLVPEVPRFLFSLPEPSIAADTYQSPADAFLTLIQPSSAADRENSMSMQTLRVPTQQPAALKASSVAVYRHNGLCRPAFARYQARPWAVLGSSHVQQVASGPASNSENPTVIKPVNAFRQRVAEFARSGAKAVAVLGVAVALVSCGHSATTSMCPADTSGQ